MIRRLPDGKTTRSVKKYMSAWTKMRKAVEVFTGDRCYAFDPDLAMRTAHGFSYSIPMHVAYLMAEANQE